MSCDVHSLAVVTPHVEDEGTRNLARAFPIEIFFGFVTSVHGLSM